MTTLTGIANDRSGAAVSTTKPRVPFLDLRVTDEALRRDMLDRVDSILTGGRLVLGPEVEELERALAAYCGTRYAVGVGSGTGAIFVALKALNLGPGDEVITSCLSFVGTANGIRLTGATPVFVDVAEDFSIDPALVEKAITPRTKAIMPVQFTGRLCDMVSLRTIADKHGIYLVEDAAPAMGAELNGKRAGSFGIAGCISFNPMKILNACGEAGAVLTDDTDVYERLLPLRYNGVVNKEWCRDVSINSRLDTVQAAILLARLPGLEGVIAKRRSIAARYNDAFSPFVRVPSEKPGYRDIYYTYSILTPQRDALSAYLAAAGIETKVQHPILIPEHHAYLESDMSRYPVGRRTTAEVLCLPAHENMSDEQVELTVAEVKAFFKGGAR